MTEATKTPDKDVELSLQLAALAWTTDANRNTEMDTDLAEAFAEILRDQWNLMELILVKVDSMIDSFSVESPGEVYSEDHNDMISTMRLRLRTIWGEAMTILGKEEDE